MQQTLNWVLLFFWKPDTAMLSWNCLAFVAAPDNSNEKRCHFHKLYHGTLLVCQLGLPWCYKYKCCCTTWQPGSMQLAACLLSTVCFSWTVTAYSSVGSTMFSVLATYKEINMQCETFCKGILHCYMRAQVHWLGLCKSKYHCHCEHLYAYHTFL